MAIYHGPILLVLLLHFKEMNLKSRTMTQRQKGNENAKNRMTSLQVSEIAEAKSIKTRTELLALARQQKTEGRSDLAEFIMNRLPNVINQIITTTWDMLNAEANLARSEKTRTELLGEVAASGCIENCQNR